MGWRGEAPTPFLVTNRLDCGKADGWHAGGVRVTSSASEMTGPVYAFEQPGNLPGPTAGWFWEGTQPSGPPPPGVSIVIVTYRQVLKENALCRTLRSPCQAPGYHYRVGSDIAHLTVIFFDWLDRMSMSIWYCTALIETLSSWTPCGTHGTRAVPSQPNMVLR